MQEETKKIQYLTDFGLSRQEAVVYEKLLQYGKQTGYEIAKEAGISRSNAYTSLAALVEKGAAYLVEESAKRYIPIPVGEFCGNRIRRMEKEKDWLTENLTGNSQDEDGYITIEGSGNIRDKLTNLLMGTKERVYLSASAPCIATFSELLQKLTAEGRKVVLITDGPSEIAGARVYLTEAKGCQIGVIVDSRYVLSGEFGEGSMNTCLYSGRKNFVLLFKNALANEIVLIKIQKGE